VGLDAAERDRIRHLWGDPKTWPPKSAEHFLRDGDWALLDGHTDGAGRPLTQIQRVTSEKLGASSCTGMQPLSSVGARQHYPPEA
jgi:hypothetical protein